MPSAMGTRHERAQRILLLNRVLDGRELASSFVLILDSLEQPSNILIHDVIRRAIKRASPILFLSFETFRPPPGVEDRSFIDCCGMKAHQLLCAIEKRNIFPSLSSSPSPGPSSGKRAPIIASPTIIIDTLHPLGLALGLSLPSFLTTLIGLVASRANPAATTTSASAPPPAPPSLYATYHTSIPLLPSPPEFMPSLFNVNGANTSHLPSPIALLQHIATTILTLHSPIQFLQRIAAQLKSKPEPLFGLSESIHGARGGNGEGSGGDLLAGGILVGLGSAYPEGVILEAEIRRRGSGRGQNGWYYLGRSARPTPAPPSSSTTQQITTSIGGLLIADEGDPSTLVSTTADYLTYPLYLLLLEDYRPYAKLISSELPSSTTRSTEFQNQVLEGVSQSTITPLAQPRPKRQPFEDGSTFSLSLTDRQRETRDAVVLPYFDAQNAQSHMDSAFTNLQEGASVSNGYGNNNNFDLSAIGQGGRILYDMGEEDDFDEEEDEI